MQEFKILHDLIAVFDFKNRSAFSSNLISKNTFRKMNNAKDLKHYIFFLIFFVFYIFNYIFYLLFFIFNFIYYINFFISL